MRMLRVVVATMDSSLIVFPMKYARIPTLTSLSFLQVCSSNNEQPCLNTVCHY